MKRKDDNYMRIISQNGMLDVPYEQISINATDRGNKWEIWCSNNMSNLHSKGLGYYDSKERAKEVMKEIRNKYIESLYTIDNCSNSYIYMKNLIYEMPQK